MITIRERVKKKSVEVHWIVNQQYYFTGMSRLEPLKKENKKLKFVVEEQKEEISELEEIVRDLKFCLDETERGGEKDLKKEMKKIERKLKLAENKVKKRDIEIKKLKKEKGSESRAVKFEKLYKQYKKKHTQTLKENEDLKDKLKKEKTKNKAKLKDPTRPKTEKTSSKRIENQRNYGNSGRDIKDGNLLQSELKKKEIRINRLKYFESSLNEMNKAIKAIK